MKYVRIKDEIHNSEYAIDLNKVCYFEVVGIHDGFTEFIINFYKEGCISLELPKACDTVVKCLDYLGIPFKI